MHVLSQPKEKFSEHFEYFSLGYKSERKQSRKILRTLILHNNNAKKLWTDWKNCPINKPMNFFIINEFLNFSENIWINSEFFYIFVNTITITVKVQSLEKILSVMSNSVTNTFKVHNVHYSKFIQRLKKIIWISKNQRIYLK